MTKIEITYRSELNEMQKLNEKLERAEKALAKKLANAQKLGVAEWTDEEHRAWLSTCETREFWLVNKEDIKKNGAWFDLIQAQHTVEEVKARIERMEQKLAKAEAEVDEYRKNLEELADMQKKEELWKLDFQEEQKEWLKDGIKLDGRYYGYTPSGKKFLIDRNCGVTLRSLHCYTLYVDGKTIFTSGEFWRAYSEIKNR